MDNQVRIKKLEETVKRLQSENKRLKTRIIQMEPHKHKKIRDPNKQKLKQLFEIFAIKKYALKVCYLGFCYDGMAYQKMTDNNTIQAYILKAMYQLSLIQQPSISDDYTRAGRTDKGVSAMGNVICLKMRSNELIKQQENKNEESTHKKIQLCKMLNAILPQDIRILACEEVGEDFNARYRCKQRSYKYFFAKNNLNIETMKNSIKYFQGTHNFINYCKMNLCNTVNFERTIFHADLIKSQVNEIFQTQLNEVYYFHFVGNSFLWHQIRYMSSVLFLIGSGKEKPQLILDLFDLQKFSTKPNYPMAPQYPLILEDCEYDEVKLNPDLQTVLSFYKTFNQTVIRKSTQKTLIINCLMLAQRDVMKSMQISEQYFIRQLLSTKYPVKDKGGKTLAMYKPSGRSFDEARESLKGKKKELFDKKMKRQQQYEQKVKQKNINYQNASEEEEQEENIVEQEQKMQYSD